MKKLIMFMSGILLVTLSGCLVFSAIPPCEFDADCPYGTFCAERACVPPEEIICYSDRECPATTFCDAIGEYCYFP